MATRKFVGGPKHGSTVPDQVGDGEVKVNIGRGRSAIYYESKDGDFDFNRIEMDLKNVPAPGPSRELFIEAASIVANLSLIGLPEGLVQISVRFDISSGGVAVGLEMYGKNNSRRVEYVIRKEAHGVNPKTTQVIAAEMIADFETQQWV